MLINNKRLAFRKQTIQLDIVSHSFSLLLLAACSRVHSAAQCHFCQGASTYPRGGHGAPWGRMRAELSKAADCPAGSVRPRPRRRPLRRLGRGGGARARGGLPPTGAVAARRPGSRPLRPGRRGPGGRGPGGRRGAAHVLASVHGLGVGRRRHAEVPVCNSIKIGGE